MLPQPLIRMTPPQTLHTLAVQGAAARLWALVEELTALELALQQVIDSHPYPEPPSPVTSVTPSTPPTPRQRPTRQWSAVAKAKVSARMKKYWAAKRKGARKG